MTSRRAQRDGEVSTTSTDARARTRAMIRSLPELPKKVWLRLARLEAAVVEQESRLSQAQRELRELKAELHQERRNNRRLAELMDVVEELLLPASSRDEGRLSELLDGYAERTDATVSRQE